MKLYLNHEPKVIYMRFIHGENLSLKGLLLWDPHYKFSKLRAGFLNPLRAGRGKNLPPTKHSTSGVYISKFKYVHPGRFAIYFRSIR